MAQLSLTSTEFPKDFRDGSSLNAAFQQLVQLDRASRQRNQRSVERENGVDVSDRNI